MVLSDGDILTYIKSKRIIIEPFEPEAVQPASVDVRLGDEIAILAPKCSDDCIDLRKSTDHLYKYICLQHDEPFWLQPGQCALGSVRERIRIPSDIRAHIDGLSSLGRSWLLVHQTAGYVDPSWNGHLTLELRNMASVPISLFAGMQIAQVSFEQMLSPALHPYSGRYQGDCSPRISQYHTKPRAFIK